MERTFFMVKPDGVQRGLCGQIICRVEQRGYKIIGMKLMMISKELAETHYAEHRGKSFFDELVSFITSGPVLAMVVEGESVIQAVRAIMGKTDPQDSAPGTIRGDFGITKSKNVVHGSDSLESAEREIKLFFNTAELVHYEKNEDKWIY